VADLKFTKGKFCLIWLVVFAGWPLFAAEVVYIDPELKFAIVDQGRTHGLNPGTNVCMLNADGFILTCSGIVVANRTKAALRLPPNEMERLQVGNKVTIKAIYLKDEIPGDGKSRSKIVFRSAKMPPEAMPATISLAADAKEREISLADGSAARMEEQERAAKDASSQAPAGKPEGGVSSGDSSSPAADPPVVQIIEQEEKDPYSELGKLGELVKIGGLDKNREKSDKLTAKQIRARTVFRAFTLETQYLVPLSGATTHNVPKFATVPADQSPIGTLWEKYNKKNSPESGVALQMRFVSPRDAVFLFGWRQLRPASQSVTTGLDANFPEIESTSETSVESTGIWAEKVWRMKPREFTMSDFGLGLDVDQSDVYFKSGFDAPALPTNKDANGIIGNARSRLAVLSLRTSAAQIVKWDRFTALIGLGVYFPLYTINKTYSASGKAPSSANLTTDLREDMQKIIDHKPSRVAADLHIGIGCDF